MTARDAARRAFLRATRIGRRAVARRPAAEPPRPPALPDGWHVAPPDFVGAGASGAATGWWHAQIQRHPDVHRLPDVAPDLHWFDRFWSDPFTPSDAARYAEWFPRPEGGIAGEWTPSYLADFWVPEMVAAAAPEARILVLLRDPVARYAAARATATGWDDRAALGTFQRGLYSEPLRRVLSVFPRDRVLVLQEEACRRDTEGQLRRTLDFLGLRAADLAPSNVAPPPNENAALPEATRAGLAEAYAPDLRLLAELAPELDFGLWTAARGASVARG